MPTAAVQVGQQGQYAYVVKADKSVEYRAVVVERTAGLETVIKSGLKPVGNRRDRRTAAHRGGQPRQHQRRRNDAGHAMNLSELFIKRPVTTTLVMLGIMVFGTMAYRSLPVSDLPAVDFPTIQVNAGAAGASPETMASTVALPLEKQFAGIAGLSNINSTSQQGTTNITLQFDLSRNIDAAAQDVQAMIGRTARSLPPQMPAPPSYQKANPGDQSIILLVLRSATLPLSMVDEYAQQTIAQRLSMVDGVAQVDVFGSQKYAVRIDLDPRELASRGHRHRPGGERRHQRQLERADRHDLRREDVRRPDKRRADARRAVRSDDRRLPQRQPRAARRGRARLRRRRERQVGRVAGRASAA